ncbi:Nup133 N terminal like-domain-containing protein [Chlamydoabsidia padenii]|nr:Nup133 N terminal like-domain-containing protein [Chlamydoabsidia padenii]
MRSFKVLKKVKKKIGATPKSPFFHLQHPFSINYRQSKHSCHQYKFIYTMDGQQSLIKVGKLLNQQLEQILRQHDLGDFLKGLTSKNYAKFIPGHPQHSLQIDTIQFPSEIQNELHEPGSFYFYGILQEIKCVWMTKNNVLYLWNYGDSSDVQVFDGEDQIISHIGLVKPKQGVFDDKTDYVLVLITPLGIRLLELEYKTRTSQPPTTSIKMHLSRHWAPCDGIEMFSVQGTDNGRIFMRGDDGHLYEICYNHVKCKLVCHTKPSSFNISRLLFSKPDGPNIIGYAIDDERCVLYTFSGKSIIEMFYLGPSKTDFANTALKIDIANSARLICQTNAIKYVPTHFGISNLYVVPTNESKKIHLIAVTNYGYRIYLTHRRDNLQTSYGYPPTATSTIPNTPNTLGIVHIRLPPPSLSSLSSSQQNSTINNNQSSQDFPELDVSNYGNNKLLASYELFNDSYKVFMVSTSGINTIQSLPTASLGLAQSQIEIVSEHVITDKIWTMTECKPSNMNDNPLAIKSQRFLMLSSRGLSFCKKQQPIDILYNILLGIVGDKAEEMCRIFVDLYGPTEVCVMCLNIITTMSTTEDVRRKGRGMFYTLGGAPTALSPQSVAVNFLGDAVGQIDIQYSDNHNSLVLYLARLLSDVWKTKLFETSYESYGQRLKDVKQHLLSLKEFTDRDPRKLQEYEQTIINRDQKTYYLLATEAQSIRSIFHLLSQCIDTISLIHYIFDANASSILRWVPTIYQSEMKDLSLYSMLCSTNAGVLRRELVIASISKRRFVDNLQVGNDNISSFMQSNCPYLFGTSDISFYKGEEALLCACDSYQYDIRNNALDDSLKHFQETAINITDDKFSDICMKYRHEGYYVGVIKLALERAKQVDTVGGALLFVEQARPYDPATFNPDVVIPISGPLSAQQLYQACLKCYAPIFDCFTDIQQLQQGNKMATKAQQLFDHDPDGLDQLVLSTAVSSTDKVFHFEMYRWFYSKPDYTSYRRKLLSMDTEYIVEYFENWGEFYESARFLSKYYSRRGMHFQAGRHLEACATNPALSQNDREVFIGMALFETKAEECLHGQSEHLQNLIRRLKDELDGLIQVRQGR